MCHLIIARQSPGKLPRRALLRSEVLIPQANVLARPIQSSLAAAELEQAKLLQAE